MSPKPFFVLIVYNERSSVWIEVASSFDRVKVDGLVAHLESADVVASCIVVEGDSDAAIASAVACVRSPPGSFAAQMDRMEEELVAAAGRLNQ